MSKKPETKLHEKAVEALNQIEGCRAQKVHGSPFGQQQLDVDGAVDGLTFKLEAKMPGKWPTPKQVATMRKWRRAKVLASWFDNVEDAVRMVTELKRRRDATLVEQPPDRKQ